MKLDKHKATYFVSYKVSGVNGIYAIITQTHPFQVMKELGDTILLSWQVLNSTDLNWLERNESPISFYPQEQ